MGEELGVKSHYLIPLKQFLQCVGAVFANLLNAEPIADLLSPPVQIAAIITI
jgi:hypothetical protein